MASKMAAKIWILVITGLKTAVHCMFLHKIVHLHVLNQKLDDALLTSFGKSNYPRWHPIWLPNHGLSNRQQKPRAVYKKCFCIYLFFSLSILRNWSIESLRKLKNSRWRPKWQPKYWFLSTLPFMYMQCAQTVFA